MTTEDTPKTPGMAEVSAKFVHEAEAATASPPSSASTPGDPLTALGKQWQEAYHRWQEAPREGGSSEESIAMERAGDDLGKIAWRLEDQAAEIPAQSIADVLVHLRMAGTHYHLMGRDGAKKKEWADTYAHLTWQAWDGLERITTAPIGTASVIVDPVLALKREWEVRWGQYVGAPDDSDETTDPLHDRVNETAYEIFQTPATTLAGVAFKLVLWARQHVRGGYEGVVGWSRPPVESYSPDLDHLPVVSALHDLERMAKEGTATAAFPPSPDKTNDLERTITDLEGATQALNNFAQSAELTTETADGLQWLALQIDGIMVEIRNNWDEFTPSRPRKVS